MTPVAELLREIIPFFKCSPRKTKRLGGNGGEAIARLSMRVHSDREWGTATPKTDRHMIPGDGDRSYSRTSPAISNSLKIFDACT